MLTYHTTIPHHTTPYHTIPQHTNASFAQPWLPSSLRLVLLLPQKNVRRHNWCISLISRSFSLPVFSVEPTFDLRDRQRCVQPWRSVSIKERKNKRERSHLEPCFEYIVQMQMYNSKGKRRPSISRFFFPNSGYDVAMTKSSSFALSFRHGIVD